jgi:hypothetical protein
MGNEMNEARKILAEARARANGSAFLNEKEEASKQVLEIVHGLLAGVGYEADMGRGGGILTVKSPWRSDEWLALRASDAGVRLELGDGNGPSKKHVESPGMSYDAVKKTWGAAKGTETPVVMLANAIAHAFDPGETGKNPPAPATKREAGSQTATPKTDEPSAGRPPEIAGREAGAMSRS